MAYRMEIIDNALVLTKLNSTKVFLLHKIKLLPKWSIMGLSIVHKYSHYIGWF